MNFESSSCRVVPLDSNVRLLCSAADAAVPGSYQCHEFLASDPNLFLPHCLASLTGSTATQGFTKTPRSLFWHEAAGGHGSWIPSQGDNICCEESWGSQENIYSKICHDTLTQLYSVVAEYGGQIYMDMLKQ